MSVGLSYHNKTAEDMAFHLMEYVAIADPPKQILTDRGSEK